MGWVYLLLQIDESNNETYKIGITRKDPQLRVKQLQTGNPNQIRLIRSYKSTNYLKIEKWLLRKYSSLKTNACNEWRCLESHHIFSFIDDCILADEQITFLKQNNYFCVLVVFLIVTYRNCLIQKLICLYKTIFRF